MRLELLASSPSLPPPLPLMRNAIVLRNPAFISNDFASGLGERWHGDGIHAGEQCTRQTG